MLDITQCLLFRTCLFFRILIGIGLLIITYKYGNIFKECIVVLFFELYLWAFGSDENNEIIYYWLIMMMEIKVY